MDTRADQAGVFLRPRTPGSGFWGELARFFGFISSLFVVINDEKTLDLIVNSEFFGSTNDKVMKNYPETLLFPFLQKLTTSGR